jgi:glycosyltransferase involved in cell wall biosynthesis
MTDIHAAIVAPLTWLLRMRHILWYAHANNSIYLIWASFFVTKIVSSTFGSCNLSINRRKLKYINQGISSTNFPYRSHSRKKLRKILYYGRLDPSKNIHLFPKVLYELNDSKKTYTLDVFGQPTNLAAEKYLMNFALSQRDKNQELPITFNGPIKRVLIPDIAAKYSFFLNLFSGSLDKTLIEATLMGIPVVTWNNEYCSQFGTWSGFTASEDLSFIIKEFRMIDSLKVTELNQELDRRLLLAEGSHAFEGWINRLADVLKESTSS